MSVSATIKSVVRKIKVPPKVGNSESLKSSRPCGSTSKEFKDEKCSKQTRQKFKNAELAANTFSRFYTDPQCVYCSSTSDVQQQLSAYTHLNAIDFAAESRYWSHLGTSTQDHMPRENAASKYSKSAASIRAYYRVIVDKEDKYILLACHVNVHGFHRGDLRFVEVNDQTIVTGFKGKSAVGNLILGDIVAVTELRKTSNKPLSPPEALKVHQDSPCIWAAHKMTVLERNQKENMVFAFLANGTAVAKEFNEALMVKKKDTEHHQDEIYEGHAFLPEKIDCVFTQDSHNKRSLAIMSSAFPTHSAASGTITAFSPASQQTEMFNIGVNAFKSNRADAAEIVELCALMGYSAANTIFNGRSDCRTFRMMDAKKEGRIIRFSIPNSRTDPTEGRWKMNCRIEIHGRSGETNQLVEMTAGIEKIVADKGRLYISARVLRATPKVFDIQNGTFFVSQREIREPVRLRSGFFKKLSDSSNGKSIIRTLYGDVSLEIEKQPNKESFVFPGTTQFPLNQFQNEYVSMLCARKTPLVMASSPFGSGKSMTIVTAALKMHEISSSSKKPTSNSEPTPRQLLVTQSNYANVNLVEIARKCANNVKDVRVLRFVSEDNWRELPEHARTEYDLPQLMRTVFKSVVLEKLPPLTGHLDDFLEYLTALRYVIRERIVEANQLSGRAKEIYDESHRPFDKVFDPPLRIRQALFHFYQPNIIMTTADSLRGLISSQVFKPSDVMTVQIDEASQVPEYALLHLFAKFPNATFGLIGDTRQLPPYCEDELKGKLKEYGIGNTMERAINGKLFPQATLKYVYRCHPVTTQLLSDLFYDGELISGVTADQRNAFMQNRNDFWPNVDYPMIIIDNKEPGYRMGTSCGNKAEVLLVKQIVADILKPRHPEKHEALDPKDLGVISFYSAQTSLFTEALRGSGVKCGTVDSFQGSEREVIIVCCTNERLSEFMQLSNRLNVALSRARQATIIIGNLEGLKKANHWSTIVERAEQHGCIVDMNKYPFNLPKQLKNKNKPKKKSKAELEVRSGKKRPGNGRKDLKKIQNAEMPKKSRRNLAKLKKSKKNKDAAPSNITATEN